MGGSHGCRRARLLSRGRQCVRRIEEVQEEEEQWCWLACDQGAPLQPGVALRHPAPSQDCPSAAILPDVGALHHL